MEAVNPNNTGDNPPVEVSHMVTLFVVCVVQFLTPFMMSAVGVALPAIGREFSASAVQLGLVEMVYILAVAMFLLPAGRMGDIYGRKKIFIAGTVLMTLSTLFNALAPSIDLFILFRFLQGCGGAMISGTSIAILSSVFPRETRGRAMGTIVACVYVGLSAGPVLSGLIISHLGWRWVFYVAVPIEMTALLLTLFKLKGEWAEARGEAFDWVGSIVYMVALFCLIFGASHQGADARYQWLMAFGGMGIVFFMILESRTQSPILDVRLLLTNRVFAFSNLATLINYASSFGLTFFFSIYLQSVKGFSPQATGMILIVQPVLQAVLSPVSGRLADRYQPALICTIGMIVCVAGLGVAASVDGDTGLWMIISMLAFMGVGFALFASPNMITVMGSVGPKHYGIASSLVATMRTIGMLTSMTIITLIFNRYMGSQAVSPESQGSFLMSMHMSMVIFCILSCGGVFLSMVRVTPGGEPAGAVVPDIEEAGSGEV